MKIFPEGIRLFNAEGKTYRQTTDRRIGRQIYIYIYIYMKKIVDAFHNFVYVPKNTYIKTN